MNLTRCNNGHFYDKDKFEHCPHCASVGMGSAESGDSVPATGMVGENMEERRARNATNPIEGRNDYRSSQDGGKSDKTVPVFSDLVVEQPNREEQGESSENYYIDTAETQPLTGMQGNYQNSSQINIVKKPINGTSQVTTIGLEMDEKTVGFFHLNNPKIVVEPVVGWLVCIKGIDFGKSFNLKSGRNFIGRDSSMDVSIPGDKSISRQCHAVILYDPKSKMFLVQPGTSRELFYLNDKVVLGVEEIAPYQVITIGNTDLMFVPCCCEQFSWEEQIAKNKKEKEGK